MDIDSFFASAATIIDPKLQGKPLIISSGNSRDVVSSASYEARKFSIHAAMPVFKAKKLCPNLIIINSNPKLYSYLSNQVFKLLSNNNKNKMEIMSIDECYLDITKIATSWEQAIKFAKKMQLKIYQKTQLNVSFGISFNKFAAKMATNLKKPKGISLITPSNFQQKLWNQKINTFYGIGKKTAPKLKKIGIYTIGDLAKIKYDNIQIKNILGKNANSYIDLANGIGSNIIQSEHSDPKSISKTETFLNGPITNKNKILKKLYYFSKIISLKLNNSNLISRNISLNLSFGNNHKNKRSYIYRNKLLVPICTSEDIYEISVKLLKKHWNCLEPIRQIGIIAGDLINKYDAIIQQTIFDEETSNTSHIVKIINKINGRFRNEVLMLGNKYIGNLEKHQRQVHGSNLNHSIFIKNKMVN